MARRTLASEITVTGTALHSGASITMTLKPAADGSGVLFRRSDLGDAEVPALYDRVSQTRLGTVIGEGDISVGVIEHLMAAVSGAELDDLVVLVDGPELPILDGDALCYLKLLETASIRENGSPRNFLKVLKSVTVRQGDASCALHPADERGFEFEIEF
ncbi:MAG: UDP-3-O-acyl-N-acetylglucosamine deacetylase, partial [Alphaproteobacteria bacterium]|nr:UDP-3-O-acyl-N-acetylglucosamine deacetylase [Alphaproteobacteria bacterium]